ncbi:MAG: PilW family protein [Gammaproteobacteria bacterium]
MRLRMPGNEFRRPAQGGFSLIELMIAVGISGFLLLAVTVMFSSSNSSRLLQTSLSGLNESGRFALSILGRDLRMAGYRDTNWLSGGVGNAITVVNGAPAVGGDTITVRYEALKDCNYLDTVGGVAVNAYSLNMANNTLQCNGQAIVGGIEQIQAYFGEDTDADGVANRMMAPDDPALDMTRVVSLRLNLLVRSDNDRLASAAQTYFFDDALVTAMDSRLRRQYSITVALRNPS